jgi:hypothetical protein
LLDRDADFVHAERMRRSRVIVWAVAGAVVVGLGVLAAPAVAGVADGVRVVVAVRPGPSHTSGGHDIARGMTEPSPSPSPRDRCNPTQGRYTTDDPLFDDMRDLGPREFAMGTATYNAKGRPATYTVAPGDADIAITQRFCITLEELYGNLNRARFCSENRYPIQPGDVFNLDPDTVTTVGKDLGGCSTG